MTEVIVIHKDVDIYCTGKIHSFLKEELSIKWQREFKVYLKNN
ncbi:hypothetical protein V7111_17515 [Neobacillus niacini]